MTILKPSIIFLRHAPVHLSQSQLTGIFLHLSKILSCKTCKTMHLSWKTTRIWCTMYITWRNPRVLWSQYSSSSPLIRTLLLANNSVHIREMSFWRQGASNAFVVLAAKICVLPTKGVLSLDSVLCDRDWQLNCHQRLRDHVFMVNSFQDRFQYNSVHAKH